MPKRSFGVNKKNDTKFAIHNKLISLCEAHIQIGKKCTLDSLEEVSVDIGALEFHSATATYCDIAAFFYFSV